MRKNLSNSTTLLASPNKEESNSHERMASKYINNILAFAKKNNVKRFKQISERIYYFFPNRIDVWYYPFDSESTDKPGSLMKTIDTGKEYTSCIEGRGYLYAVNNHENCIDVYDYVDRHRDKFKLKLTFPWDCETNIKKPKGWIGDIFFVPKEHQQKELFCLVWNPSDKFLDYKIKTLQKGIVFNLDKEVITQKYLSQPCSYQENPLNQDEGFILNKEVGTILKIKNSKTTFFKKVPTYTNRIFRYKDNLFAYTPRLSETIEGSVTLI